MTITGYVGVEGGGMSLMMTTLSYQQLKMSVNGKGRDFILKNMYKEPYLLSNPEELVKKLKELEI